MTVLDGITWDSYSTEQWFEKFDKAAPGAKQKIAMQWMTAIEEKCVSDNGKETSLYESIMYELARYTIKIREMAWAIPAEYFQSARPISKTVNYMGAWLRTYLNISNLSEPDEESTCTDRIRAMWLHPDLHERRRYLFDMLKTPADIEDLSPQIRPLLREAAWDVAEENGMAVDVTDAATLVQLRAYPERNKLSVTVESRHAVSHAINALLVKCEGGPWLPNDQKMNETREVFREFPIACVRSFQWVEIGDRFPGRAHPLMSVVTFTDGLAKTTIDNSIGTWLPGSSNTIDIAKELGLPHAEILANVAAELTGEYDVAVELPAMIENGSGPQL